MDADHLAVDNPYDSLKEQRSRSILPLVINIADVSPILGWRGFERKLLDWRGRLDLTLCQGRLFITWLSWQYTDEGIH